MNVNIPKAEAIRLECLRLALGRGAPAGAQAITVATQYEQYVSGGQAKAKPAAPPDSSERRAARPAKKASSAPARSGKASGSKPTKPKPAAADA